MTSENGFLRRPGACGALRRFLRTEAGAVTVDWIVLTAIILFLGLATGFYLRSSVPQVAERMGDHLEDTPVTPE